MFKIGDLVRFKGKELELPSVEGLSVKLDTGKFIGKVAGSIDCPEGVFYYVDICIYGATWNVKVKEDQIMSLSNSDFFNRISPAFNLSKLAMPTYWDTMIAPKPLNGCEKKMSKSHCIKLLERYRAEREKINSGRRFELRLRNSVINEALERAIELLKGGES